MLIASGISRFCTNLRTPNNYHRSFTPTPLEQYNEPRFIARGNFSIYILIMANDFLEQVAQNMYADQAAPLPPELAKALKDPQTYRQLQEGAVTGSLGIFGDTGEVIKQTGLAPYVKYLPPMSRGLFEAMQAAPTTEGVTQLLKKWGYPFSDTESTAHEIGTYFSPVGVGALTYAFPKALRAMKPTTAADKPPPPVAEQQETFDPSRRKFLKATGATGVATLLPFAVRNTPQKVDLPPVTTRVKINKFPYQRMPRFDSIMDFRYSARADLQGEMYAWLDKNRKMLENRHDIEIDFPDIDFNRKRPDFDSPSNIDFPTSESLKGAINMDLMVRGPKGRSVFETDVKVRELFVKDIQKRLNDPNTPKTEKDRLNNLIEDIASDYNDLTPEQKLDRVKEEATLRPLDEEYEGDPNYADLTDPNDRHLYADAGKYSLSDVDTFLGSAEKVTRYILDPTYRKTYTLTKPEKALLQDVQQELVEVREFLKSPKDSDVLSRRREDGTQSPRHRFDLSPAEESERIDEFQQMIDERYPAGFTGNDTEDLLRILRGEYDNRVKDAVQVLNLDAQDLSYYVDFDRVLESVKQDMKPRFIPPRTAHF